jgi:hypothetical protein
LDPDVEEAASVAKLDTAAAEAAEATGGTIEDSIASDRKGIQRNDAVKEFFSENVRIRAGLRQHSSQIEEIARTVGEMTEVAEATAANGEEAGAGEYRTGRQVADHAWHRGPIQAGGRSSLKEVHTQPPLALPAYPMAPRASKGGLLQ